MVTNCVNKNCDYTENADVYYGTMFAKAVELHVYFKIIDYTYIDKWQTVENNVHLLQTIKSLSLAFYILLSIYKISLIT